MSADHLTRAVVRLRDAGVASPEHDARALLAHVLDEHPAFARSSSLDSEGSLRFEALVDRRAAREPLQHLLGRAWFRHVELRVGPGVFVPRPETEVMTGWVLDQLAARDPNRRRVVDLGTGSGAIAKAIADEAPAAEVYAVELSEQAARWAGENLAGTGVELRTGDMADAFTDLDATVDVVVANPPYIPLEAYDTVAVEARDHDPTLALFSGTDGLDAIRVVVAVAARLLRAGGLLAYEHAEVQAESAPQIALASGAYEQIRDRVDLLDRPRFVTAVRRRDLAGWAR